MAQDVISVRFGGFKRPRLLKAYVWAMAKLSRIVAVDEDRVVDFALWIGGLKIEVA